MTRPDLDALEALAAEATPGPWVQFDGEPLAIAENNEAIGVRVCYVTGSSSNPASLADAALIVAAVNALPALLAYVRELESLVERMARADSGVALAMRERCAQLLNITRSDAQLMAGDMTAGEWRTVSAVLRSRAAAIRAIEP